MSIRNPILWNLFAFAMFAVPAAAEPTAFINVNVIPMTSEAVLREQTVIIQDGRIAAIDDVRNVPIPDGFLVVDGTDRYLMPGLSEMHAHVPGASSGSLQRILHLYVANGVTLMRGMLGQPSHLQLRQQLLDGAILGPRLVTSGPSFNGRSVSSPNQAAQMVREQHAAGYDFLKIHPGLTRDEFDAVAGAANAIGMPFAGHVTADVGVRGTLAAGIATIDHLDGYMQALIPANDDPTGGFGGFFGLLLAGQADESKIPQLARDTSESGTWNVPTQSLFEHAVSGETAETMRDWPEMRYMPESTVNRWADSKNRILNDPNYRADIAARAVELRRFLIKALHDEGARLLLGSDSPQIFNVPGFVIHRELQILVDSGLSPYQALRTGTVNPAEFLGYADRLGTLEPGREADLVLLDDNPLADISATRRVHGVMLRGRWISQRRIRAMLDDLER